MRGDLTEKGNNENKALLGLKGKFLLGLAVIFFCFSVITSLLIGYHDKKTLEEKAFQQTEMVMAAVESVREYIREVLRPRMYEVVADEQLFILEAMSTSYVSRVVMDLFKQKLSDFDYRRVSVNARNPDYEANEIELRMIEFFLTHPGAEDWKGMVKTDEGRFYMSFRPIRYTQSCLNCHGEPMDAPPLIVENYGPARGFYRTAGVVGGVQSVSIPVDFGFREIMKVAWSVIVAAFIVVFFLYVVVWYFFNNVVVGNLQTLLEIFRGNLRDEKGVRLYKQALAKDEFDEMAVAVQSVASHLREAHEKLEGYAKNLEGMVAERTSALEQSKTRLREQIAERSLQLKALNTITELTSQSVQLPDILPKVLEEALRAVSAKGAGIYLLDRETGVLRLQSQWNAQELEEEIPFESSLCLAMLERDALDFEGFISETAGRQRDLTGHAPLLLNGFNVPLCCHGQVLGAMTLLGIDVEGMEPHRHELLYSIGHQIGITIQSLQNITRLVDSKELLQSVFDGITDAVVLLDHDHRIKMVNRAFLERHKTELEQVLNRTIGELPPQKNCPFRLMPEGLFCSSRKPVENMVEMADGSVYEVRGYPIFSERETVRFIVCYARDITEQKQVEQRMQQTEKLIALGQLAAGVAHEINNPLGVILCYADILREEMQDAPEQRREDIEVIEKHARSCQRIVTDLLNFARGQKSDRHLCSINLVVEEVVAMVRRQFMKKRIDFIMELEPDLPELLIDSDRMRQVFLNLLMNSSQAIAESGTILLHSSHLVLERKVQVVVEDNGEGIDATVLAKIFDPFFTTKPHGTGTGLGLSVSYGIIRDHDGDIRAESIQGEFSRFIITLPVP